jgi:mannose/cellobiose epimerase-like protein (N-acyl-D-glucosamine 2-epimerase family)
MSGVLSAAHDRWLEAEGDRLLAFSRASRHPAGGFAWLDVAGRPQLDQPVELWITCRMTHVFALGHLMGRPGSGTLADHGVQALTGRFRDAANGGWYAGVAASGEPTSRVKAAYGHAFVVLAAASATCAARPGGRELLDEALSLMLEKFWDDEHGMVVEEWDETFSTLDGYRGVNANMHTVEAFLAAADAVQDPDRRADLLGRALRIVSRVVHDLGPAHSWRLPEHFDAAWTPELDYNRDAPGGPVPAVRRDDRALAGVGPAGAPPPGRPRRHSPGLAARRRGLPLRRLGPRGLGSRRGGRLRLHRGLGGPSRRPRANALGRRRGHGHRGGVARGDR